MSYTPATTAFGEIEDYWAGTVTNIGLQIIPFEIYLVAYNFGVGVGQSSVPCPDPQHVLSR